MIGYVLMFKLDYINPFFQTNLNKMNILNGFAYGRFFYGNDETLKKFQKLFICIITSDKR